MNALWRQENKFILLVLLVLIKKNVHFISFFTVEPENKMAHVPCCCLYDTTPTNYQLKAVAILPVTLELADVQHCPDTLEGF